VYTAYSKVNVDTLKRIKLTSYIAYS